MDQKRDHLFIQRTPSLLRLLRRFFYRNDHLAKQACLNRQVFVGGKRKHVGWIIHLPILGVQSLHFGVADQGKTQLDLVPSEEFENGGGDSLILSAPELFSGAPARDLTRQGAILAFPGRTFERAALTDADPVVKTSRQALAMRSS